MVVAPEAQARSPRWNNTSWLLFGALGGGVAGIAIVWFLVGLRTRRARQTQRRNEEVDRPVRPDGAFAGENRRDVRAPEYDKRHDVSQEWGESNPPWRDDLATAHDDRWAGSGERKETNLAWGRNRGSAYDRRQDDEKIDPRRAAPAYDAVRDALGGRQEAGRPRSRSAAAAYNADRDALTETEEAGQSSGRDAASAYDAFFDALRDGEEADQPSGGNAVSADDAVRGAPRHSATPAAPKVLDQRGATPPRPAKTQRRNTDKMLFDSLEQEITSLLGRPISRNSQRQEADQPSSDEADEASAQDAVREALGVRPEVDQPSGHNTPSAYDAARDAWPRPATPAELDPLDQLTNTAPTAPETGQLNAGKTLYDSFEQRIASLLGRSTVNGSQSGEADQPSSHNAATAYDAVRDALGERQEADQPSGHNAASAYDAVREARPRSAIPAESNPLDQLGTTPPRVAETRQPNAGKTPYDSFEQSMASLLGRSTGNNSQSKEADQLRGRNTASAYDAVRDALTDTEEVDQPSGHNAASAYDAVRDALTEREEADQPGGYNGASADEAV